GHSSKLVGAFVKAIFVIVLSVRPMMWLAAMRIRAACDHVLHANSTLVDRVDLATPLSLSLSTATGLSALAPAQRAGAQRLRAMAQMRRAALSALPPLSGE